jgi:hypothetical protein
LAELTEQWFSFQMLLPTVLKKHLNFEGRIIFFYQLLKG